MTSNEKNEDDKEKGWKKMKENDDEKEDERGEG